MLDLIKIRRYLHQHPELGGEETNTQQYISHQLTELGLTPQEIGGTGVIATIGNGTLNIMVRVDIDALPIQEINTFEYRSLNSGVSHKCGHDGHTSIGIGLAEQFVTKPIEGTTLHILFQPSEENGMGAKKVMGDPLFKSMKIDYVIALHNVPGYEQNTIVVKKHSFTPAVQSLKLDFQGKTSHAAEPENGFNPHEAIAELILKAREFENRDRNSDHFLLFSPIYTRIGEKNYGIAPGDGEIHFTIRSWQQNVLENKTDEFLTLAQQTAAKYNLLLTHDIFEKFHANKNAPEVVNAIITAAKDLNLTIEHKTHPFSWGEDFGLFTQHIPGAMFGLGSGKESPALHNPDYDFPDEIISTGIQLFYQTISKLKHAK